MDHNGETLFNKTISDSLKKNLSYRDIFKSQVIMEINKKIIREIDEKAYNVRNSIIFSNEKSTDKDYHSDHIPILTIGTTTFQHICRNGIYLVAVMQTNVESFIVWDYLLSLYDILKKLNLSQPSLMNHNLLKLINIVNFTLNEEGVPQKNNMNIDTVKKFLIQSY
ncbi:hypothetical protein ACO0SA_000734 [Hanseniaspora valbyensis]